MAYRLAPQAEADLEDLALYVFLDSGSLEIADRLIESITQRCDLLAAHPRSGRARDDLRPGFAASQCVVISSSTASPIAMS